MTGVLIGLDHGIARIGVAVCDASQMIAREYIIIERTSKKEDFAKLNTIANDVDAVGFVVGIPYSDVEDGVYTQADKVKTWIGRFAETTDLPIITWDESESSDEAEDIARRLKRRYDAHIDDLAARVILQRFLDALHDGMATFPPRSDQ